MANPCRIRRAAPADAEAVTRLIHTSFASTDLQLTIYGCKGITKYLAEVFHVKHLISDDICLVAEVSGSVAGFVELRESGAGLCLSYIATASGFRNSGIARKLLDAALDVAAPQPGSQLTLDVFAHNDLACNWYRRLGFEAVGELVYWRVSPGKEAVSAGVRVSGMAQAEAGQSTFGFSNFTLKGLGGSFRVGRLGERWFRLTDSRLLLDPGTLAALNVLDPTRDVLLYAGEDTIDSAARRLCTPLLRSIRMARHLPLDGAAA